VDAPAVTSGAVAQGHDDTVRDIGAIRTVGPKWVAPALGGAAVLAGAAYVRAVDPARGGVFPACVFHRVTGWWCPGCGMTRALHHLLGGDLLGALSTNVFLPLVVGLAAYLWLSWLWPPLTGRRLTLLRRVPSGAWAALVAMALLYGVLRNLPVAPFPALAP
jgi:Protein of unknown function (DUF2752)